MVQVLLALIPYTRQNFLLAFKPNQFFNELEKTSNYSDKTLRVTFSRAKNQKLFTIKNDQISLSLHGNQIVQPFIAQKLSGNGQLMVIFDIPEDYANLRRKFRNLLRQFQFKQIQYSVWMSDKDCRIILSESIKELGLQNWVQLYESARIL